MADTDITDPAEPVIRAENLSKTFLDFWRRPCVAALSSLNLSVSRGEIFGLLGPNGSGKSTTIKLLLGLIKPSSGRISILGAPPSDTAAKERIGYLPEVTNLHSFLTPAETLRYYAGLFGLDRKTAESRIAQLLEMVGLSKAADRQIGSFSKGMARRVGIAQALINNPDLIILDEPTSGLDPIASRAVKDWLILLAKAGKTVFMTSHLLADVEDICDRVAVICDGHLQAVGSVRSLLEKRSDTRFTVRGVESGPETERIREIISRETGSEVEIDHPGVKLESFFLDVVASADSRKGGGAVRSSALAPFLSQPR